MTKTELKPLKNRALDKRKPGRPKRAERPIGPAELAQIGELWLRGRTRAEIARTLAVSESTVRHHLNATIRPLWRDHVAAPLGVELAKIDLLERVAWLQFESKGPAETTEQMKTGLVHNGVELAVVERVIRKIHRPGQKTWLEVIEWCITERCKLAGYYRPKQDEGKRASSFRIAGMTADQVNDAMIQRMVKVIRDRKKYETAQKAAEQAG